MTLHPPEKGPLVARTRFLILVLVVLCLTINWANILTFNFTVICMHPKNKKIATTNNTTNETSLANAISNKTGPLAPSEPDPDAYLYREVSHTEKSQAMGVVAAGALIANFPIVTIINWYGPRFLFTLVGLFGSVATALVPFAMKMGWEWFLGVRVLQGIAFAGDMATFGHFVTNWTYHKQYAFFTATLCIYVQLAPIFTNPVSGLFCESSYGWPAVYYFHAIVSFVLFTIFYIVYRNHPNNHPFVNQLERNKIARGRDAMDSVAQLYVPYWDIIKSPAAWAVFFGGIGNFSGINLLYQFTPTYLHEVQNYEIVKTGFSAALPPLIMAIFKEFSGFTNDRIPERIMGETVKTRVYNSIAFFICVIFLIVLSFIPKGHGTLSLWILTCAAAFLGFNTGGFYKSGSLIAGPYAPFVLGQVSTAMTITMLIVPLIVNPLTPNNTQKEWAHAFYAISAIIVASNCFYVLYAKGELEPWAKLDHFRARMEKRKTKKEMKKADKKSVCQQDNTTIATIENGIPRKEPEKRAIDDNGFIGGHQGHASPVIPALKISNGSAL